MLRSIFAIVLAAALATAGQGAHAETVRLAADEWCPYNCSPASDKPGYLIELARRALGQAGIDVAYTIMPWSRALSELAAGGIDGAVGGSRGDYPNGVFPRSALGRNQNVLAVRPDSPLRAARVEDLQGLHLGAVQNYSYDSGPIDAFVRAHSGPGGTVELLSGTELQSQNLRKLLAMRVDAVLDNGNVLRLAIAEMQPRPEVRLVPIGDPDDVSIAFSEKNPNARRYAELIDAGLVALRQSGELRTILARYHLDDWAP